MKKTISIILAIMMVATLSVAAFAANPATSVPDATNTKTATGYYVAGDEGDATYYVNVTFGNMVFKYTDADQVWDQASLKWVEAQNGTWAIAAADQDKVTVENRSSEAVNVTIAYAKEDATEFTGTVTGGEAENVATGDEKVATLAITGGTLTGTDTELAPRTLGTVTVTIAEKAA